MRNLKRTTYHATEYFGNRLADYEYGRVESMKRSTARLLVLLGLGLIWIGIVMMGYAILQIIG